MPGALEGLLVVAIEQAVAAPMCTLRLADAGARVIKIERPEGDTARHYDAAVQGLSAYFAWLNRSKESAVLDLKSPDGLALAQRLAAHADVVVQNLAPGAAARLGLDAAALTALHPRLIAVDIVGYGGDTPYRDMRAYDMLVQAESGVCAVTGTPETPSKVGVSVADIATGMNAHAAILEALIARGASGRGRAIEIAMFDGMADWMSVPLLHHTEGGRPTARHGLSHASIYPYARYACRDGDVVIAVQHQGEWHRFCEGVLGRPDLTRDDRFADNARRVRNREALDAIIAPRFAALAQGDAIGLLEANAIAWARVSGVADLAGHPALRCLESPTGDGGHFLVPRPAGREPFAPGPVPRLGEHTDRIRAEFAAP
ncbi:CaiB/BaiF CoA transferase family protein [Salinarimonas soli]|uniref:CoA transferase n=1 Tax=Salinarimonas soli TaxID=1638099 RepID=A0A5B2VGE5_9HYPH|nr:CaiB/BaiF CoA-transferase family protein [Salinarimonas soli]KAA2237626.1 CoA transferase [Salinarimonas soli]